MIHEYKKTSIVKRLEMIKDIDPDFQRILNDSYTHILQQEKLIDMLENQLYELTGTE